MTAADNSKKRPAARTAGREGGRDARAAPAVQARRVRPGRGRYFPDLRYPSAAARVRALRGA
jgi:hypothetical protein